MIMNMLARSALLCAALAASHAFAAPTAPHVASKGLPILLVSSSGAFDRACPRYYRQGNDPDVLSEIATEYCGCIAGNVEAQGLGYEMLDFLARTYSEDLTTFIHEYPNGENWMQAYFAAEEQCKNNTDFGSNQPPAEQEPNPPPGPIEAGSWGGIVRDGPGRQYRKLGSLEQGERIMLLENTSVWDNGYPWWRIEFWGGREGYQWGGIICGLDAPIEGTYEVCR